MNILFLFVYSAMFALLFLAIGFALYIMWQGYKEIKSVIKRLKEKQEVSPKIFYILLGGLYFLFFIAFALIIFVFLFMLTNFNIFLECTCNQINY